MRTRSRSWKSAAGRSSRPLPETATIRCSRWKNWPGKIPGHSCTLPLAAICCWQDILRLAHLVVTSRHVGDDPELHAKALRLDPTGARILFAPVQALPMASSDIRTRLTAGEGCEAELPEAVRAVIRREKLYKKGSISQ